ncbi:MAG TPA: alpha/beta hydrolase [Burkholderiaceae bacterium]|jgi:pimeloyl-ACP methyl ester carboxylesterase
MSAATTVVFLHGALNDHRVWAPLVSRLTTYTCLALDLPGHAEGAGPPLDSIEALADWLWTELDRRGVQQAALVGHSMGSLIALEAAARRPERAHSLTLVGTACPMRVSEGMLTAARDQPEQAMAMVDTYSRSQPDPEGQLLALMQSVMAAQPAMNLLELDLRVCDRYTNGLEAAAKVTCPVQLILGEHDKMTPIKRAMNLAETLKAPVHKLNAGHALMAEAPEEMSNLMIRFLES